MFIFERERERDNVQVGGGGRERETESEAGSRFWAVSTETHAELELRSSSSQAHKFTSSQVHDLRWSWMLNWLSHPGTHKHDKNLKPYVFTYLTSVFMCSLSHKHICVHIYTYSLVTQIKLIWIAAVFSLWKYSKNSVLTVAPLPNWASCWMFVFSFQIESQFTIFF